MVRRVGENYMAWNSRTNNKAEKEIEEYLVERIKDLGGILYNLY